jgi:hypothetical protein
MQSLLNSHFVRSYLIPVIVITILVVGGYFWLNPKNKVEPKSKVEPTATSDFSTSIPESIKQIPPEKLPSFFPLKIPLEKNAKVLQNYSQIIGNKEQSTRQFISQKSIAENFRIYKDYLQKNSWTIVNTLDQPEIKSLSAKKTPNNLIITMTSNNLTKEVIVDITMIGPAAVKQGETLPSIIMPTIATSTKK